MESCIFKPSGQLPLRLFVVPEPLERNMVSMHGELVTKKVWLVVLDEIYNSQHFTLCRAILAFQLAQGLAGISNYTLCAVLLYLRNTAPIPESLASVSRAEHVRIDADTNRCLRFSKAS